MTNTSGEYSLSQAINQLHPKFGERDSARNYIITVNNSYFATIPKDIRDTILELLPNLRQAFNKQKILDKVIAQYRDFMRKYQIMILNNLNINLCIDKLQSDFPQLIVEGNCQWTKVKLVNGKLICIKHNGIAQHYIGNNHYYVGNSSGTKIVPEPTDNTLLLPPSNMVTRSDGVITASIMILPCGLALFQKIDTNFAKFVYTLVNAKTNDSINVQIPEYTHQPGNSMFVDDFGDVHIITTDKDANNALLLSDKTGPFLSVFIRKNRTST